MPRHDEPENRSGNGSERREEPPPIGLLDGGLSPNQLRTFEGHLSAAGLTAELARHVLRDSNKAYDLVATAKRWTLEIPPLDVQLARWTDFHRWLMRRPSNNAIFPREDIVALSQMLMDDCYDHDASLILCYGFDSDQSDGVDAKLSGQLLWEYMIMKGKCNVRRSLDWDKIKVEPWEPPRQMPYSRIIHINRPKGFYAITLPPVDLANGLGRRFQGETAVEVRACLGSYRPMAYEGLQMMITCPIYFEIMGSHGAPRLSLPGYQARGSLKKGSRRKVPVIAPIEEGKFVLELIGQEASGSHVGPGVMKIVSPKT